MTEATSLPANPSRPARHSQALGYFCVIVCLTLAFWNKPEAILCAFLGLLQLAELLTERFKQYRKTRPHLSQLPYFYRAPLNALCIGLALLVVAWGVAGYLDLPYARGFVDQMSSWISSIFEAVPKWLFRIAMVVFCPVAKAATFLEDRDWLVYTWASLASLVGFLALHFLHRTF